MCVLNPTFPPLLWLGYYMFAAMRTRTDDNHKALSGSVIHMFCNLWRENNAAKAYTEKNSGRTGGGVFSRAKM